MQSPGIAMQELKLEFSDKIVSKIKFYGARRTFIHD